MAPPRRKPSRNKKQFKPTLFALLGGTVFAISWYMLILSAPEAEVEESDSFEDLGGFEVARDIEDTVREAHQPIVADELEVEDAGFKLELTEADLETEKTPSKDRNEEVIPEGAAPGFLVYSSRLFHRLCQHLACFL
ncbi:hypothetical protein CYMTET_16468 [Cymbomonas tetramitiformis]|uniref:Uncharacterized protein n=1 Tax=Cymbomonas tetramitiformis TaxID=36881 RepID=A0AAE0L887_9CHLO|nr:hypothetical protein CYMTET_16468 [Cymbomonas tetramitiformis]